MSSQYPGYVVIRGMPPQLIQEEGRSVKVIVETPFSHPNLPEMVEADQIGTEIEIPSGTATDSLLAIGAISIAVVTPPLPTPLPEVLATPPKMASKAK